MIHRIKKIARSASLLLILAGASLPAGMAAAAPPAVTVVEHAPAVVAVAPARIHYRGRWLVYREGAYYYRHGNRWVVARAVPARYARFHHPHRVVVVARR